MAGECGIGISQRRFYWSQKESLTSYCILKMSRKIGQKTLVTISECHKKLNKIANKRVNQTAGSSVARRLVQWPPLVTLGVVR